MSTQCAASLLDLYSSQLPCASTCYCNELATAFMQVIPYVAELLAKVHEQQAQSERIVGFQSLFKCVYYPICMDASCSRSYLSVLHYLPDAHSTGSRHTLIVKQNQHADASTMWCPLSRRAGTACKTLCIASAAAKSSLLTYQSQTTLQLLLCCNFSIP